MRAFFSAPVTWGHVAAGAAVLAAAALGAAVRWVAAGMPGARERR